MTEEEMFQQLLNEAIENKSDEMPEDPNEFDLHVDNHYNVYMCIRVSGRTLGLTLHLCNTG